MKFPGVARRGQALSTTLVSLAIAAVAVLTSCGGGEQTDRFIPERVIVFGDDAAALDDSIEVGNARKYGVNFVNPGTTTIVCSSNPQWSQYVAATFGYHFAQCNPTDHEPRAQLFAQPGWKLADVANAIATFQTVDSFKSTDMVAIMVGVNDVLELYQQFPTMSEAEAVAIAEQRGAALATQVNLIAETGAKVLISTIIDIGISPYALKETVAHSDTHRAPLISRVVSRFNAKLRTGILNDGRKVGLVLSDEIIATLVRYPQVYGIVNITEPACDPAKAPTLLECTTATLKEGASDYTWLWADDLRLASAAQTQLGSSMATRALNNPFR